MEIKGKGQGNISKNVKNWLQIMKNLRIFFEKMVEKWK